MKCLLSVILLHRRRKIFLCTGALTLRFHCVVPRLSPQVMKIATLLLQSVAKLTNKIFQNISFF